MRGRSESSRKNRERLKKESGEQKSDARSGRPGGKVLVSATFVFVAKILLISSCCRGLASNVSHLDHYPHIKREKEMLVFHNAPSWQFMSNPRQVRDHFIHNCCFVCRCQSFREPFNILGYTYKYEYYQSAFRSIFNIFESSWATTKGYL